MRPNEDPPTYHPGEILAADPGLADPNFRHTLVYLANHSAEGAFGLIMNRPTGKSLGELPVQIQLPDALANIPVYAGGPVRQEQLLIAVFEAGNQDSELVCRLEVNPADVVEAMSRKDRWVRAFLGYAGWGEGQLDQELSHHAWKICRPSHALLDERLIGGLWPVFVGGDDRWRELMPFLPDEPGLN